MIGLKENEKEFQGDIYKECIQMEKESHKLKENGGTGDNELDN